MGLFSQRKGIRSATKAIQIESMDDELRNRLWSSVTIGLWDYWSPYDYAELQSDDSERVEAVVKLIWLHYLKLPIDTMPAFDRSHPRGAYNIIREHFFDGQWWESYDLI